MVEWTEQILEFLAVSSLYILGMAAAGSLILWLIRARGTAAYWFYGLVLLVPLLYGVSQTIPSSWKWSVDWRETPPVEQEAIIEPSYFYVPEVLPETEFLPPEAPTFRERALAWLCQLDWRLILFSGWVGFVLIFFLRLVWTFLHVMRAITVLEETDDSSVTELLRDCVQKTCLRRIPRLSVAEISGAPLVTGFFRPVIVVPPALLQPEERQGLYFTLLHEMVHLKRKDNWWLISEWLVRTFFFFHPVISWASRKLHEEMEYLCDQTVVEYTEHSASYADFLLQESWKKSSRREAWVLPFHSHACAVTRRVRRILSKRRETMKDKVRSWMAFGFLIALLIPLIAFNVSVKAVDGAGAISHVSPAQSALGTSGSMGGFGGSGYGMGMAGTPASATPAMGMGGLGMEFRSGEGPAMMSFSGLPGTGSLALRGQPGKGWSMMSFSGLSGTGSDASLSYSSEVCWKKYPDFKGIIVPIPYLSDPALLKVSVNDQPAEKEVNYQYDSELRVVLLPESVENSIQSYTITYQYPDPADSAHLIPVKLMGPSKPMNTMVSGGFGMGMAGTSVSAVPGMAMGGMGMMGMPDMGANVASGTPSFYIIDTDGKVHQMMGVLSENYGGPAMMSMPSSATATSEFNGQPGFYFIDPQGKIHPMTGINTVDQVSRSSFQSVSNTEPSPTSGINTVNQVSRSSFQSASNTEPSPAGGTKLEAKVFQMIEPSETGNPEKSEYLTAVVSSVQEKFYGKDGSGMDRRLGQRILTVPTSGYFIVVDTPENLQRVEEFVHNLDSSSMLNSNGASTKSDILHGRTYRILDDSELTDPARLEYVKSLAETLSQMLNLPLNPPTGYWGNRIPSGVTSLPEKGYIIVRGSEEDHRRVQDYLQTLGLPKRR